MPHPTFLIVSYKDLDDVGENYRTFYRTVYSLSDSFADTVELKLPSVFLASHVRVSIYCTAQKHTTKPTSLSQVIKSGCFRRHWVEDLNELNAKRARRHTETLLGMPVELEIKRRLLFSVHSPIPRKFNYQLQAQIVGLIDEEIFTLWIKWRHFRMFRCINMMSSSLE